MDRQLMKRHFVIEHLRLFSTLGKKQRLPCPSEGAAAVVML